MVLKRKVGYNENEYEVDEDNDNKEIEVYQDRGIYEGRVKL
jgi:hypothetical protein